MEGDSDEQCPSLALASSDVSRKEKSKVRGSEVDGGKVWFTVCGTLWLSTQGPRVESRRHCNAILQYLKLLCTPMASVLYSTVPTQIIAEIMHCLAM